VKATLVSRSDYYATCLDCPKSWRSANALAVGSQHAEREGHYVEVVASRSIAFDGRAQEQPTFTEEVMFA
jgi:hypothetical protein